jgi:hypothetical protein
MCNRGAALGSGIIGERCDVEDQKRYAEAPHETTAPRQAMNPARDLAQPLIANQRQCWRAEEDRCRYCRVSREV